MARPTKEDQEATNRYIKLLNVAIKLEKVLSAIVSDLDRSIRRPGTDGSHIEMKAREALKEWDAFIHGT